VAKDFQNIYLTIHNKNSFFSALNTQNKALTLKAISKFPHDF
jgi:hypothetical protein